MRNRILMIGTDLDVRGGISAMVNVYVAQGLFSRWDLRYIATHRDGSKLQKAVKAAGAWLAFIAELLTFRIALLHVHIASDASFWRKSLFIVPAHWLGVPYVLHMHGGQFLEFYRAAPAMSQRFIRYVYRNARVVIALSSQWRETLLQVSPESRIVVVPNPVTLPAWQAPLDEDPPTVLFLGLIKEAKGVYDLVNAWARVVRAIPAARLVLGGVGEVDEIRALAASLGVADSLDMPGWIVGDAKEDLIKRAWVFALPSHHEALPMSILEAMAAGVPVVASRVGGIPAAVDDGRTGILIEPRDVDALAKAIVSLLGDAARRKTMGIAARNQAAEFFSAEVIVPRVEDLWHEVLGV
jgi:glycosyltransferase involved in cell wall biosynthesis